MLGLNFNKFKMTLLFCDKLLETMQLIQQLLQKNKSQGQKEFQVLFNPSI